MSVAKKQKSLPPFHKHGLYNGLGFFIVVGGVNLILQSYFGKLDTLTDWVLHVIWWIIGSLIYAVAYNRWIYPAQRKFE